MDEPTKEVFDNYQSNYERRGGEKFFRSLSDVKELHLGRIPPWLPRIAKTARILDAGCATGYLLGLLHELGYTQLTGVDVSSQLTATARARLPREVEIHCADLHDYLRATPDGSFDVILFHHVIEHIPREHVVGLLREFHRCLAPGGWLNVKTPNAANIFAGYHVAGDITHVTPFNELSLRQVAELADFPAETFEIVYNPPKLFWSWRHPGRAVVRVLNRFRWRLNRAVHWAVAMLVDVHPALKCAEWELDALLKKSAVHRHGTAG